MNRRFTTLAVCLFLAAQAVWAEDNRLPRPNWFPGDTATAIGEADVRETLRELYLLAREGRGKELLSQVRLIADSGEGPDPERDLILYTLAISLGDFGPGVVGPEVLEFLAETRSRTLVPHDENREMGVPLYNVRAAAAGALAEWQRYESLLSHEVAMEADRLVAKLKRGDGGVTLEQVRRTQVALTPTELESLVAAVPDMPDAGTAAMVLAELSPAVMTEPSVMDRLFELLEHRELGATAALALARSGDPDILERLSEVATTDQGLASVRAALALETVALSGAEP